MLDVIIPVKARSSIMQCIDSLLACPQVDRILVCDGGSEAEDYAKLVELSHAVEKLDLLPYTMSGFNKSYLLNQGIAAANADYLLISDADILWNPATLDGLQAQIMNHDHVICTVAEVTESDPNAVALKRDRYTYRITHTDDAIYLLIQPAHLLPDQRPGCGLLYTRRQTLLGLGGYKEQFQGWGWEDQDLLIRAQLLGVRVTCAGTVMHLSHGDDQRNRFHHHRAPSETRNANIQRAIASLSRGEFYGDLAIATHPFPPPQQLHIDVHPTLRSNAR
jgi:glycosyltransferase involved in cell wall biosynthesis